MKLCTPGLLGLLITNLTSDFYFSKWRIQYGGHEILETTISAQLCTRGFSGSLITNFKLDFQNSTDFELILMRYSMFPVSPNHRIDSLNKYCKFFCSDFILTISGSIVYHEGIHNGDLDHSHKNHPSSFFRTNA